MRSTLRALLVAAALCPLAARAQIRDVWPDPASLGAIVGQPVTIASSSPFAPRDISPGAHDARDAGPATSAAAQLYLPADASAAHKVPAVVLLQGPAGPPQGPFSAKYGKQLAAMGVAVLAIDSFGSRKELGTSLVDRVTHITETMFVTDAYAGLLWLADRPEIDARRVVLAGFNYGGMATIYAMYDQVARTMAPKGPRFVGHVAYYTPCIARFENHRTTGAPLLMLEGGADELIRPERCEEIVHDLREGGSQVSMIGYPGAVQQWDGALERQTRGRNLSGCSYLVTRDGEIVDQRSDLTLSSPFRRKMSLALCTAGADPYPIGRDDAVRARSNRDFGAFLRRVFAE